MARKPRKRARLTATVLCRSALMILEEARQQPRKMPYPDGGEPSMVQVGGLFGANLWIGDDELFTDLKTFVKKRLRPLIEAWAFGFQSAELGPQYLLLPLGVSDVSNQRFGGVAMRCIIVEGQPIGDRDIPSRIAQYYDVTDDTFKEAPCSTVVTFWVHTPDSAARFGPNE